MPTTNGKRLPHIFLDEDDGLFRNAISLGDIVNIPVPEAIEILPGLIFQAQNTVALVDPGLYDQAFMFAVIVGHSIAGGETLPPLGTPTASETLLVIGGGNRRLAMERLKLKSEHCKSDFARRRAQGNLHLTRRTSGRNHSLYLNQASGQRTFKDSIPDDCKLVIFADANWWLTTKEKDKHDYKRFDGFHSDLNQMGIATLSFVQNGRGAAGVLENEFLLDGSTTFVELTKDPAAPHEFGGGFNVVRTKISEHDSIPLRFQFWYKVTDGKLDFGWECRDPADADTAKNVEMKERQKRVRELAEKGMPQKEIAVALGVDQATVSRDVAKIKAENRAKEQPKPAVPDGFDDGMAK